MLVFQIASEIPVFRLSSYIKQALGSPRWRLKPFFSQQAQAHTVKSFLSYPSKYLWTSLPGRGEANLFSKPTACLAALLSLEGAAWDGYGLSNGHLPRLAETSIPLRDHKRAIKITITTYYWLGLVPSAGGVAARGMSCWPLPAPAQRVPRAVWSAAAAAGLLSHTLAPGARPSSRASAGAAASILLFFMTLVGAGFGQKNVFWRNHPSFQTSPSSDQVSSAK